MRVWIMVNAKIATLQAGDKIREKLKLQCVEVFGIYDQVVEVNVDSSGPYDKVINKLNKDVITPINSLEEIAACTTYLSIDEKTKPGAKEKPFAYVLIDAAPPVLAEVRDRFFKIDKVQKADIVLGPFDIVVEVAAKSREELTAVMRNIFGTSGIIRTVTLITFP